MPKSNEPLKVDPTELHLTADQIDGHSAEFLDGHQSTHWQASQTRLGSGLAGGALPAMLAEWEADGARFNKHFTGHAEGHRVAATRYVGTDTDNAEVISDAGSEL
ncbi:hypothetical protein M2272_004786 [Mycobacterium frederiksbergense]|uniref:WXG100 family type VII secretion target n=1 Tax=Mycolicibacterium frederiksbergense TaxID=117567 RepID=A0ABT6L5A3_9MYCO|nr:type VII secretion target [Mycolicibacterium frederiksbergense]MDH6198127.1 hypothetical protein [Mycolicibacterium frederiksbergense]